MTNEELEKIRNKYNSLIGTRQELLNLQKEIEEYEQNPIVRKYLELKERLESDKAYDYYETINFDNNKILEKSIKSVKVTNTNNIYVCMGTYQNGDINSDFNDYIVSFDDPNADFREYISVESASYEDDYCKLVPISECDAFEKKNIVLYPPKGVKGVDYYCKIRNMYFDTAIKYGCDKALEKVLYRKNMQESFKKQDK